MPPTPANDSRALPAVSVCLTDPMALHHTTPAADWFASEIPRAELARAAAETDPSDAVADMIRRFRAGSVTVAIKEDGRPRLLLSAKGAVGSHERFLTNTANGWYVSDHFRNAISQVPVADRAPSPEALADHYIFRAVHADLTYAQPIERVSNAEVVTIDLGDGTMTRRLVDKLIPPAERLDRAHAIDRLDAALATTCDLSAVAGRTAVLFSGGIDSTVILTYLHPDATPLTFVPDTPEFAEETVYARSAAALLDLSLIHISEPTRPMKESRLPS